MGFKVRTEHSSSWWRSQHLPQQQLLGFGAVLLLIWDSLKSRSPRLCFWTLTILLFKRERTQRETDHAKVVFLSLAVSAQAFKLDISPQDKTMAQIGDILSLTCSTTGCETPSFSWRTQMDSPLHGRVRTEGSKSVLIMDAVSFENEHSYLCTATCGSKKLERGIQVDVYCKFYLDVA